MSADVERHAQIEVGEKDSDEPDDPCGDSEWMNHVVFLSKGLLLNCSRFTLSERKKRKRRRAPEAAPETHARKDIVAYCVRKTQAMIHAQKIVVRDGHAPAEEYKLAADWTPKSLLRGWARRMPSVSSYGANYISFFEQEVADMFNEGIRDKSLKMNAAQMRARLKRNHPHTFCLPSEADISGRISHLSANAKASGTGFATAPSTGVKRKRGRKPKHPLPDELVTRLRSMVEENVEAKPKDILLQIRECATFNDIPDDAIKRRFSSLKVAFRKKSFVM